MNYSGLSHSAGEKKSDPKMPFLRGKKIETLKAKRIGLKSEAAYSGGQHYLATMYKNNAILVPNRNSVLACNA